MAKSGDQVLGLKELASKVKDLCVFAFHGAL